MAVTSTSDGGMPADATLGAVSLTVADLDRVAAFYERSVGLEAIERGGGAATLGAGSRPIVELRADPGAQRRPPGTTGLFHLAILVESRLELARALRRVADSGWRFTGASDHLVSEALYLRDPEGNGIEIYRDRAREEWRYANGQLQMDTIPLDLEALLGELAGAESVTERVSVGTRIGHVHLNVAELRSAEAFYAGALGFDVTVRGYPGALFLSAGGYHHHVGLNTWAGEGAPPPPPGSLGLERFAVLLPDRAELERAGERLEAAGYGADRMDGTILTVDPSGNRVALATAP